MSGTETIDPRNAGLDMWPDEAILDALIDGQRRAVSAVETARDALAATASAIAARLGKHGRIVYAGAGSSGIIAALDGIELLGTYGWPVERVALVLASGDRLAPLTGGEEDDEEAARDAIAALRLTPHDVVIAVAASGATPYTVAAAVAAGAAGALTVGIASNAATPLLEAADIPVLLDSGPEVIVGSTRMGAGTAQKAALNLISTLTMIRLGHVYDGLMVSLRADNRKLRARAIRTLRHITGCTEEEAMAALDATGGSIKPAALMLRGVPRAEAERMLDAAGNDLRAALTRAASGQRAARAEY
jgi:N-acetylmuramic acid 6-phosphate etherase